MRHVSAQAGEPLTEEAEEAVRVEPDADPRVRRPLGAPPEVDDGPPAAELRGAVDLHVAPLGCHQVAADHVRDSSPGSTTAAPFTTKPFKIKTGFEP